MSKKYCVCGKANDFIANFCFSCGHKFVILGEVKDSRPSSRFDSFKMNKKEKVIPAKTVNRLIEENDDNEEDLDAQESVSVPNIEELDVDIILPKVRTETIASIQSNPSQETISNKRSKVKINRKTILDDYRKEAGTSRPKG